MKKLIAVAFALASLSLTSFAHDHGGGSMGNDRLTLDLSLTSHSMPGHTMGSGTGMTTMHDETMNNVSVKFSSYVFKNKNMVVLPFNLSATYSSMSKDVLVDSLKIALVGFKSQLLKHLQAQVTLLQFEVENNDHVKVLDDLKMINWAQASITVNNIEIGENGLGRIAFTLGTDYKTSVNGNGGIFDLNLGSSVSIKELVTISANYQVGYVTDLVVNGHNKMAEGSTLQFASIGAEINLTKIFKLDQKNGNLSLYGRFGLMKNNRLTPNHDGTHGNHTHVDDMKMISVGLRWGMPNLASKHTNH